LAKRVKKANKQKTNKNLQQKGQDSSISVSQSVIFSDSLHFLISSSDHKTKETLLSLSFYYIQLKKAVELQFPVQFIQL